MEEESDRSSRNWTSPVNHRAWVDYEVRPPKHSVMIHLKRRNALQTLTFAEPWTRRTMLVSSTSLSTNFFWASMETRVRWVCSFLYNAQVKTVRQNTIQWSHCFQCRTQSFNEGVIHLTDRLIFGRTIVLTLDIGIPKMNNQQRTFEQRTNEPEEIICNGRLFTGTLDEKCRQIDLDFSRRVLVRFADRAGIHFGSHWFARVTGDRVRWHDDIGIVFTTAIQTRIILGITSSVLFDHWLTCSDLLRWYRRHKHWVDRTVRIEELGPVGEGTATDPEINRIEVDGHVWSCRLPRRMLVAIWTRRTNELLDDDRLNRVTRAHLPCPSSPTVEGDRGLVSLLLLCPNERIEETSPRLSCVEKGRIDTSRRDPVLRRRNTVQVDRPQFASVYPVVRESVSNLCPSLCDHCERVSDVCLRQYSPRDEKIPRLRFTTGQRRTRSSSGSSTTNSL